MRPLRCPPPPILAGALLGIAAVILSPKTARSQSTSTWTIFGATEAQVDHYSVSGDPRPSPYRFEGTFLTARINLNALYDNRAGRTARIEARVRGSDDPYLANDGFVIETLRLEIEDGARRLPYRLGVGDVYANFSRRTLQRSIRGVSLELQPPSAAGHGHSLVAVSGSGIPQWSDIFDNEATDLWFSGLSYLWVSPTGRSTLVANVVHANLNDPTVDGIAPVASDVGQLIGGVAAETRLGEVKLEGELAYLSGESDGQDLGDPSGFVQLTHHHRALWWRLRFEENGEDFRPLGGMGIIADRRNGEFQGRWSLNSRGQLAIRAQHITDNLKGTRPQLEKSTWGASYQGSPLRARPSFVLRLAWDRNDIRADDGSRDTRFDGWRLELGDDLGKGFSANYSALLRDNLDVVRTSASSEGLDQTLTVGKRFSAGVASGGGVGFHLRGGITHRRQTGHSGYTTVKPLIDFSIHSDHHRLDLHLAFLDQDFTLETTADLENHTRRLTYSFTRGPHTFLVETGQILRLPDGFEETDSRRYSLRYHFDFGRK
jgi:hypothetical protein